jgi:hypothetical protein
LVTRFSSLNKAYSSLRHHEIARGSVSDSGAVISKLLLACGAGVSIKPGVKRGFASETPGI